MSPRPAESSPRKTQTGGVTPSIDVPEAVRQKASALGEAGTQWLADLPALVAEIAAEWELDVGDALAGGSGSFVAPATTADGTDAILKLAIPDGLHGHQAFADEQHGLELGAERGFVRVLRADGERRAMLQERLGRPLGALGLTVEQQIDAIAATLREVWHPVPTAARLRTGFEQAEGLEMFVLNLWNELGQPCEKTTIRQACEYAHARRDAWDDDRTILIHGDAHPANVLEAPDRNGFRLIDPDAMRSIPEHDLAIPLRDWSDELLASDDATALGLTWCARLAERAGADQHAIWQWAFLERVSTGLFMTSLGDSHGAALLAVAECWADARP